MGNPEAIRLGEEYAFQRIRKSGREGNCGLWFGSSSLSLFTTRECCRRKAAFNRAFEAIGPGRLITPVNISPCFSRPGKGQAMQDGSVTVERRKRGPDVWCFRWREGGLDGRKIHRRIVLGTADDPKSIASVRKVVVGLRREINLNDVRIRKESITLADLSRHFQQRELVRGDTRIAHSTRKAYEGYLRKWIEPRWGEYRLFEIREVEIERRACSFL
jgi:hypothetical protein